MLCYPVGKHFQKRAFFLVPLLKKSSRSLLAKIKRLAKHFGMHIYSVSCRELAKKDLYKSCVFMRTKIKKKLS